MTVGKELFGEGKYVEFKSEIPKKHEKFLKDIIAFANTSGGKTILGIEDVTGEITGIGDQNPFKLKDSVSNMIFDSCTPQIYTDITVRSIEDKTILEVEVFPGKQRPYYLKAFGKEASSYIRVNGTSRPASERKLKELEMEGMKLSYDTMPEIGARYDKKKALELCEQMYQTALKACRTEEEKQDVKPLTIEKLEDFGILKKDGRSYLYTHAFTMLTKPTEPFIKIQCAVFKGIDRDEFIDRKEFTGPIQEQVEMANQFVLRHINMGATIEGLYRHDIYELPTKSIREMIINANLHRSFLDPSPVQVSIYDDRLEIDSPGMLYDGLTLQEAISGKSRCRNTAVAEAFKYMKLVEGWGTGLPRLFSSCEKMGLSTPSFAEFGDGLKVVIYRKQDSKGRITDINTDNVGKNVGDVGEMSVNDGDIKSRILELISKNNKISAAQIAKIISAAQRTVERYIKELRTEGRLIRRGSSRGGYWETP